jgi:hypothetical protein
MKVTIDANLFWFLPKDARLDLSKPSELDTCVQHTFSHGRYHHVQELLRRVDSATLRQSFLRISGFVKPEVRGFWEDFFAIHH